MRISDIIKLGGDNGSWIEVKLTQKQKGLLEGWRREQYDIQDIGYIDPSQIRMYYCHECEESFEGSPKLEIGIDEDPSKSGLVGSFTLGCTKCKKDIGIGFIYKEDKPNKEYIVVDLSGEYIPFTKEVIDSSLKELEKSAEEGNLDTHYLERVQRQGEKIGYDIKDRVKDIEILHEEKYRENYIIALGEKTEKFSSMLEYGFGYIYEGGFGKEFEEFFKIIKSLSSKEINMIEKPEIFNEKLTYILWKYGDWVKRELEENDEKIRGIKEEMTSEVSELELVSDITKQLGVLFEKLEPNFDKKLNTAISKYKLNL